MVTPETQNWGLEPMGVANPSKTHWLTGLGPVFVRQEEVGRVLNGSGLKLTQFGGGNPDRWLFTQTCC